MTDNKEWEQMADDAWAILTAPADQKQRLRDKVGAQLRARAQQEPTNDQR